MHAIRFIALILTAFPALTPAFAQGQSDATAPISEPTKIAIAPESAEALENFPGFQRFYLKSQFTLVPIPVFATQPDEGQTYGLMPTLLVTSPSGQTMRSIVSPMIGYNSIIKIMGTVAALMFPSKHSTLSLFAGVAQNFYQEYELIYTDKKAFNDRVFFELTSRFYNNPYGRFFGLGPTSAKSAKTYFAATTYRASLNIAYAFLDEFRLGLLEQFYYVNLGNGINGKTPDTLATYGLAQGVFDNYNLTNAIYAAFNSHGFGARETPFSETELNASFLFSAPGMGSQSGFAGTNLELKETLSYGFRRRFSTVFRLHYKQLAGDSIPFFEMPSLGGPNELRGYTAGRFVDKGAAIFQLEQRTHIAHINFFNRATGEFYIDPFFEVGQVFHTAANITWGNLQPTGGVGFRVHIPPNMVARVDVGFSREDNFQVFTVLNYPF